MITKDLEHEYSENKVIESPVVIVYKQEFSTEPTTDRHTHTHTQTDGADDSTRNPRIGFRVKNGTAFKKVGQKRSKIDLEGSNLRFLKNEKKYL